MTNEDFNKHFDRCIARSRKVLVQKSNDYANINHTSDRLVNFKNASLYVKNLISPLFSCLIMQAKHTDCIMNICNDIEAGREVSQEYIDEKFGDWINYAILLEALILDLRK